MQGWTVKTGTAVVINLKNCTQPSQPYVALSRAQNLQQIYIVGKLHEDRWFPSNSALFELKSCEEQEAEMVNEELSGLCLEIVSLNVRSLQKHIPDVRRMVEMKRSDVLCLQETWLPANITGYHIQGYDLHLNSVGRGKGIATYTTEDFNLDGHILQPNLQISKVTSQDLDIINVYRSDSCKDFELFLSSQINRNKETIIVGDMNIDLNRKGPKQQILMNFLKEYGLHQLVTKSTHQSENVEATKIDHVYATEQISQKITIAKKCIRFSDHDALYVKIKK